MTLRPSLSRKLNGDRLTPLHLVLSQLQTPENAALQQIPPSPNQQVQLERDQQLTWAAFPQRNMDLETPSDQNHQQTQPDTDQQARPEPNPYPYNFVSCLLQFDKDLARVKGKGGQTPLHHAAQIGDCQLLKEILTTCPMSILDVMVESQTASHVALNNHQLKACIFLKEWLRDASFEDAYLWRKKLKDWKDANNETWSDLASEHKKDKRKKTELVIPANNRHISICNPYYL